MLSVHRSMALAGLVASLVLACLAGVLPAQAQDDNAILRKWAAAELAKAPASVRNGSPVERARFAMTRYCEVLQGNKVGVNSNLWTRLQQLAGSGDASRWTCSDHAMKLEAVFRGVGVKKTTYLVGQWSKVPTPNSDHGALAITHNGKAYLFDPWQLAVRRGSYSGAGNSIWNGITSDQWESRMRKQGYYKFSDDGGGTWYPSTKAALAKHMREDYGPCRVIGIWKFYSGGQIGSPTENTAAYTGTLTVKRVGPNARAWLKFGPSEEMSDVAVTETTLVFTRRLAGVVQRYRGFMTGERAMRGTFSHLGQKTSHEQRWWASR